MARKYTPLLSDALDEYLAIRAVHLAPTSLANDRSQSRAFVSGIGDCRVSALTPQRVEAWFIGEAERQQAASYNKVRQRVSGFIKFLTSRGWLVGDPLAMVGKRKTVKRERLRLSAEELLELPDYAASDRDKAIIILACNTAMRASEIRGLRVKDLDLANGWLRVRVEKSSREDVMPVTQELAEAMREWLAVYERQESGLEADWYLFPSRTVSNGTCYFVLNPEKPIVKMAAIVQKAMVSAGHTLEKGEGIHTLRRSVARIFFDQACAGGHDAALRMTSSLLHHSSTQVTEIYLGLQHERLSRDEVLRGKRFLSATVKSVELTAAAG